MNSWVGGVPVVLHHRIVELRKSKKITQEVLSNKIGVSRSALSQYELGSRQPDYDIIKRMADYFGVTTDYLLGRSEHEIENIYDPDGSEDEKEKYKMTKDWNDFIRRTMQLPEEEKQMIADMMEVILKKYEK